MAYLEPNLSADKTLGLLEKLIESGRYTSTSPIAKLLEDADKIKAKIEDLYKS